MKFPNPLPRPDGELEALRAVWEPPQGWRLLSAVNNTYVGLYYIGTALLFFVLAGVLALMMRTQLAVPENTLIGATTYNQLFTMHGTIMMFLFAVPAVEAMGVLLLPNMLGARDLPFPRLGAYAFWAYFFGGIAFFCSLFFGAAPDGGWFMYPPLTSGQYSPGINADFWLLGIGFIEISAIAGAVEIIVGVLRTRAPGMTLARLPIYAWSMLVLAAMIVFAFPAVILATALLELERAFDWPFFIAARGGDPLLWQHLFWFFGHPEVYIIFLPAAGMVSMIVPAMARIPLPGYRFIVLAFLGTGFLSFLLWVHHMFATGIPSLALSFFSAASMAVALPAGIQVFTWIAAFARGRLQFRTPALFVLGFLAIFVLGGLTGVMLAVVPFNWQVHDTYFVVAHLHYVLVGGMVFPLFGALYYWMPFVSRNPLSERLGRWVFGLMFLGFNVTFFPMHVTGLAGMPRRVYTYPAEVGWEILNFISTMGAYTLAAGIALFVFDVCRNFRFAFDENAGNVWGAGTLEWLPSGVYSVRSIPQVTSVEPLWDQPDLARDVEAGRYYLPGTATGRRETLATTAIDARPQYLILLPGPGWTPFIAAVGTAAFFLLLTFKLTAIATACGVVAVAAVFLWLWGSDAGPVHSPVDIGANTTLPTYVTGPSSHSWWAMVVLILVAATLFASAIFTYLYLWSVAPQSWPAAAQLPASSKPWACALLLIASSATIAWTSRGLKTGSSLAVRAGVPLAAALLVTAFWIDLAGQRQAGLDPAQSGYAAAVSVLIAMQGFYVAILLLMAAYTLARSLAGKLDSRRRVTFDNTMLLWHYVAAQGLISLALIHGFPRLLG